MKRFVCLLLVTGCATGGAAQKESPRAARETKKDAPVVADLKDPVEILKKADAATKAVDSVQYKAVAKATGFMTQFTPPVAEGGVVLAGESGQTLGKARIEINIPSTGSSPARHLVAGTDEETYFLIDHDGKMVYEDIDPAVQGKARGFIRGLAMREFIHPNPFGDEVAAEKAELKGITKIGGVDCYEIDVKYSGGQGEATWFFGTNDFLPRRVSRKFRDPSNIGNPEGGTELTVTDLVVNPTFVADPFKLVVPAGYTKSNDFAP